MHFRVSMSCCQEVEGGATLLTGKAPQSLLSAMTRHVSTATWAASRVASDGHVSEPPLSLQETIDLPASLARMPIPLGAATFASVY